MIALRKGANLKLVRVRPINGFPLYAPFTAHEDGNPCFRRSGCIGSTVIVLVQTDTVNPKSLVRIDRSLVDPIPWGNMMSTKRAISRPWMTTAGRVLRLSLSAALLGPSTVALAQPRATVSEDAPETWRLSSDVVASIGGAKDTRFRQISGVVRTARGDFAVADRGSHQIQVFNSAGMLLNTFAGTGADKAPFQNVQLTGRSGDSVLVFDPASTRLSVFGARDGFIRTRTIPATPTDRLQPIARFLNGDLLLQSSLPSLSRSADGSVRDSVRIGVLRGSSDSIGIVRAFPAQSNNSIRVWGNLVWIGDHETNELTLVDKSGKVTSRVRVPANDDDASDTSFGNFQVSPEGFIWIERLGRSTDTTSRWIVMQRSGNVVAQADMPKSFEPTEVGSDYIVGIKRNRDGQETVAMYRIWK